MDLLNLVEACVYCRNERTVIGLLGLIMLLPMNQYITSYLAVILGFYGAFVAVEQIFSSVIEHRINFMIYLAVCAFIIITAQAFVLIYCSMNKSKIQRYNEENT